MVRHGANLIAKKDRHRAHRKLHVNTISFQFFDTLCQEFVVMDQRPKVSVAVAKECEKVS
jgi:hypothetical protein